MRESSGLRVEVIMSWAGTLHHALLVGSGRKVTVGESAEADFFVPAEVAPRPFTLIDWSEGHPRLELPSGTSTWKDRDELVDATSIILEPSSNVFFQLGDFDFQVTASDERLPMTPRARPSWMGGHALLASLLFHVALLTSVFFAPPSAGALSLDLSSGDRRWIEVHLEAIEASRPEPPPRAADDAGGAEAGTASAGDEGTVGTPDQVKPDHGGRAVRGESKDHSIPLTRENVTRTGVLGVLASWNTQVGVSSPFGAANASGFADNDALSALMAAQQGMGPGSNGLGMQGAGRGAGCQAGTPCGAGTVGIGGLSTSGSDDYGTTAGTLRGNRVSRGPTFHPGTADVMGGLSRELIRRVVARNRNQVRACYEEALAQRPDLAGRITIRWMIRPDGAATSPSIGSSELRNEAVESCITRAISHWMFPASEGVTAVSYPFIFQSDT